MCLNAFFFELVWTSRPEGETVSHAVN